MFKDNFIILDANQTFLDYQIESNNIKILTLGTTIASIQYDTSSLTSKDAEVWTFLVDTPYNLSVALPEEATILGLSDTPVSIDINENRIVFSLFPDQWEISYVFPITPPAHFQVTDLKITPTEVRAGEEVLISLKIG